jgi:flavin reductase (DIM6/NTAB) family NADH-FMN oxidoreductase RutF
VNISLREATYSFGNILERKAFTVNIPGEKFIKEADYFGLASGRDQDKFKKTGLTPVKSSLVDAPYIEEFPLVLECSLLKSVNIGLHTIFVGEVKDVKADAAVLDAQGIPDIAKILPMSFNPATRTYYATGKFLAQAFSVGARD